MLTVKAVAARLGVSPGRVRQLIADQRLPSTLVGNTRYIHERDLALVAERKTGNHTGRSRRPANAALSNRRGRTHKEPRP